MKANLGGERLGSGAKIQIDQQTFNRSTFDLSYAWRSTIGKGTLIPFMNLFALPVDTFEIDLQTAIYSNPLVAPMFGSDKLQLDVFKVPVRLYQAQVHNNKLGIGRQMQNVKLPLLQLAGNGYAEEVGERINPSSIFSYLEMRDIGSQVATAPETGYTVTREFNAVSYLAYFDIFKNYYAFKQQEDAYIIHTESTGEQPVGYTVTAKLQMVLNGVQTDTNIPIDGVSPTNVPIIMGGDPKAGDILYYYIDVNVGSNRNVRVEDIYIVLEDDSTKPLQEVMENVTVGTTNTSFSIVKNNQIVKFKALGILGVTKNVITNVAPKLVPFKLKDIDDMREDILSKIKDTSPYIVNNSDIDVLKLPLQRRELKNGNNDTVGVIGSYAYTNEGILVKTYQSDIFNNYLDTESITGAGGINEITAIDTSEGNFKIETLILANKVFDMLNGIQAQGDTFDDWQKVLWQSDRVRSVDSPVYMGGLIKEIVYDEVVSNSATNDQPLATLGGITRLSNKHKGGKIRIKVDEPSVIIGIVSITPRVDYSQGNAWHNNLKNYGEFHNPYLDGIGFQDLLVDQMNANATEFVGNQIRHKAIGKQPAWLNYQTNVNKTFGNFAVGGSEEYMVQNRRYSIARNEDGVYIPDADPYIDPVRHTYMFATQEVTAQPYWLQIGVGIKARRKMSSKIMPKL